MKKRPWYIVWLSVGLGLVPVFNVLGTALVVKMTPYQYFALYFSHIPLTHALGTFVPPWIAAFAVFKCRKWSYFLFHGTMLFICVQNLLTWRHFPGHSVLAGMLIANLANLAVMGWMASPSARALYFTPKLRWWDTPPRYKVRVPATVQDAKEPFEGEITDISIGGVFLESPKRIEIGVPMDLAFQLENFNMAIKAKAIRRQDRDRIGYGMLIEHTAESRAQMKDLVQSLSSSARERPETNVQSL